MAVTVQRITDYLTKEGIKHGEHEMGGEPYIRFTFSYGEEGGSYKVTYAILLEEESKNNKGAYEFLQFRGLGFADKSEVKGSQHLDKLREFLLYETYTNKFGSWGLDTNDGDLYVCIAHSMADNDTLTDRQLDRMVKTLMIISKEIQPRIRGILEKGDVDFYKQKDSAEGIATRKLALLSKLLAAGRSDLALMLTAAEISADQITTIEVSTNNKDWEAVEGILNSLGGEAIPDEI